MKIVEWRFKDGMDRDPDAVTPTPVVEAHIENVGWVPYSPALQAVLVSHCWYPLRDLTCAY